MRFIALNKAFRSKDSRIVEVSLQPKEKPCLSRHNLIRHPLALTLHLRALSMSSRKVSVCTFPHPLSGPYPQPPAQRRRVNEDIFLNIVLYIGSLLLIGAAGLFVTSVTSSQDETAIFRVLAMALGAVVFYGAGLLTYRFVERLRIASYSFAATGLAFIPLTGVATYVLKIWVEGRYVWLLTSLVWHCSHCWSLCPHA